MSTTPAVPTPGDGAGSVAPPAEAEYVVVGAGLLGLSVAFELRRRGHEVVVLERAQVGHDRSGSKGSCRIFRCGYDDPRYVNMARLAQPLWRDWEQQGGVELLRTTGQLTFGPGADVLVAALTEAGAPFELLSDDDAFRRFPDVADHGPAVFEPDSGVINAERSLAWLRASLAGVLFEGVVVTGMHEDGGRVSVASDRGVVRAPTAVCCAGPGSASLLASAGVALPFRAALEQIAYFIPRSAPPEIPVLIERGEPALYALPTPDGAMVKVGLHHAGPAVDPLAADLRPDPEHDRLLGSYVARLLPGYDPRPVFSERCLYDNTPDENFVVDRVGRIVVGAGTSGHGFKFGPLFGELLADLADGSTPRLDIEWLGARRPELAGRL